MLSTLLASGLSQQSQDFPRQPNIVEICCRCAWATCMSSPASSVTKRANATAYGVVACASELMSNVAPLGISLAEVLDGVALAS